MPRGIALGLDALGVGVPGAGGPPGWWDPGDEGLCVWAAYQAKGAASLLASYTDLSGNGNDCFPGVAPAWDPVNGWKFNGLTQYLETTFVPQNDQTQSMLVQFTNWSLGGSGNWPALIGCYHAGGRYFSLLARGGGASTEYFANGQFSSKAPAITAGNLGLAGNQGYENGGAVGGAIGPYGGAMTRVPYIGAENRGAPIWFAQVYEQAVAIYDCTLTAPQVLAVATAMAAL